MPRVHTGPEKSHSSISSMIGLYLPWQESISDVSTTDTSLSRLSLSEAWFLGEGWEGFFGLESFKASC